MCTYIQFMSLCMNCRSKKQKKVYLLIVEIMQDKKRFKFSSHDTVDPETLKPTKKMFYIIFAVKKFWIFEGSFYMCLMWENANQSIVPP